MTTTTLLPRIAALCYRHRRVVVLFWIALAVASVGLAARFSGPAVTELGAGSSQSSTVLAMLRQHFPEQAEDTITLAVHSDRGALTDPAVRTRVDRALGVLRGAGHVAAVHGPYDQPGGLSTDGRTGYAVGVLDVPADDVAPAATKTLLDRIGQLRGDGVDLALGGAVIDAAETPGGGPADAVGLAAAVVVLLIAFGSVLAAGLPIVTALAGLTVGLSGLAVLRSAVPTPGFASVLAAMIGLGVGIDYALIVVTRYRENLAAGQTPEQAVVTAAGTAGRSVVFAGSTVVIALCGLLLLGLDFLRGVGLGSALTVTMTMAAAVTLLPALLGFVGTRIDRFSVARRFRRTGSGQPLSSRWAGAVARRPVVATIVSAGVLLLLAAPVAGLRFGMPDAATQPHDTSGYRAHRILAAGYGAGFDAAVTVAVPRPGGDPAAVAAILARTPGVASVSPQLTSPDQAVTLLVVRPTTGSQDPATARFVRDLRAAVAPQSALVGGKTAAAIDFATLTADRMPLVVAVVIGLSLLLLVTVFRSVPLALKAGLMNLLSIGAAIGFLVFVLQSSNVHGLFGFPVTMPVTAWVPMILFPVLFGISMDYEVFMISRIRESWERTGDTRAAVRDGLSSTARVITAGAAIMIVVFCSVMLGADLGVKQLGLGLAAAVAVDATVIRLVLVPASMELLGRLNWWMPGWLDRLLPGRPAEPVLDAVS